MSLVKERIGVGEEGLDGRHHHRKERRYDRRGKAPLVLKIISRAP